MRARLSYDEINKNFVINVVRNPVTNGLAILIDKSGNR